MERQWNGKEDNGSEMCNVQMRGCSGRARMACQQGNCMTRGRTCSQERMRCEESQRECCGRNKIEKREREEVCQCKKRKPVDSMQLAMAYVPWQRFENLYEPEEALQSGTLFSDLNLPYVGCGTTIGCGRGRRG